MSQEKIKVLISDELSDISIKIFKENGIQVDLNPELGKNPSRLSDKIGKYDGLIIRSTTKITQSLIKKAYKLRVIGRAGIGVDNVNVLEASARGIVVMNTPLGNSITTAEHTIAMILSVARQIPDANASTHAGKWDKSRYLGVEVTGKVLGLIGAGNIGSVVASRAIGLKMRVVVFDPFLPSERAVALGITKLETLGELLKCADFVSLHLPKTERTINMISKSQLMLMKPGARLINCARGGLVDEEAVASAITSGHLGGAALDVFNDEPTTKSPLFGLRNVVCTPHLGASTREAQENVARQVAEQMSDFLKKGVVSNAINAPSMLAEEAFVLNPWIELVEVIGSFMGQITESAIKELEIEFVGDVGELNLKPLVAAGISALLTPSVAEETMNMVSAPFIARQRGIKISEIKKDSSGIFESYIKFKVISEETTRSAAGTIYSDGRPRFIQINGINLEAEPQKFMLYTTNKDVPGYIGALGTVLGNLNVNIATFALGRAQKQGKAIALVGVDDVLTDQIINKVRALHQVIIAKAILF